MHTPTGPRPPEAADVPRRRRVCRDLLASGALAYLSTRERSDVPASGQTNREISPYSADQAAMFARGEMTTVADTRADGERAVGGHRNLHILVGGGGRAFPDVRAPGHARQKPPTCRDVAACGEISSPVAWHTTRPQALDKNAVTVLPVPLLVGSSDSDQRLHSTRLNEARRVSAGSSHQRPGSI